MAVRRHPFRMDHPVLIAFLLLAIIAFMYFAAEVIKPLALAVLLSLALAPLVRRLEKWGMPRGGAVVLSVVATLLVIVVIGVVVTQQLNSLAQELPQYEQHIHSKLSMFRSSDDSTVKKLEELSDRVNRDLIQDPKSAKGGPSEPARPKPMPVEVVRNPTVVEQLSESLGPVLEVLAVGFFVLILVLFILLHRDELNDRIVRLFGDRLVTKTTRTMEEVGHRISRYLAMFATVNSTFGLIVGVVLALLGIPYAVLWGFLAAMLRFIPYAGPATAFALPLIFSIAHFAGWREPLEVVALFVTMEVLANSFLEPVIYGKTTGVSALGLLVAAMFWTWLWGAVGLLLSTPLTVCLAVVGKYVPSLSAFGTLLGEETELEPDVKLFQRLIAFDQPGAIALIEDQLKKETRIEVFEQTLIPTLARMERDYALGSIEEKEREFTIRIVNDLLEQLSTTPETTLATATAASQAEDSEPATRPTIIGVAAEAEVDALILEMAAIVFASLHVDFQRLEGDLSPLALSEQVTQREPEMVVISHLAGRGTGKTRYLVKRLHAVNGSTPIVVGCWRPHKRSGLLIDRYRAVGARRVVFSLTELRDHVLELARLKEGPRPVSPMAGSTVPEPVTSGDST